MPSAPLDLADLRLNEANDDNHMQGVQFENPPPNSPSVLARALEKSSLSDFSKDHAPYSPSPLKRARHEDEMDVDEPMFSPSSYKSKLSNPIDFTSASSSGTASNFGFKVNPGPFVPDATKWNKSSYEEDVIMGTEDPADMSLVLADTTENTSKSTSSHTPSTCAAEPQPTLSGLIEKEGGKNKFTMHVTNHHYYGGKEPATTLDPAVVPPHYPIPPYPSIIEVGPKKTPNLFALIGLSIFCICSVSILYLLYSDINVRIEHAEIEFRSEKLACSRYYVENRCHPSTRVPALERQCIAWEQCMEQNLKIKNKSLLLANVVGEIIQSFMDSINLRNMLFLIVVYLISLYFSVQALVRYYFATPPPAIPPPDSRKSSNMYNYIESTGYPASLYATDGEHNVWHGAPQHPPQMQPHQDAEIRRRVS